MPYWSSSRVGTVPQGQPPSAKKKNDRRSRRKGITMEDLKQQTAMRLAQEQEHRQCRAPPRRGEAARVVESPGYPQLNRSSATFHGHAVSTTPVVQAPERAFHHAQSLRGQQEAPPPPSSPYLYGSSNGGRDKNEPLRTPHTPLEKKQQRGNVFHRSAPEPSTSASSFDSSSQPSGSAASKGEGTPKSKLPHGLTVYELKEMTRARLQVEAAERELKEMTMARLQVESAEEEVLGSVPSSVRVASPGFPHGARSIASYPTEGVDSFGGRANEAPSRATDGWETASVSTAGYDYPESESVYSANGAPSFTGDEVGTSIPFSRTGSYPSGQDWADRPQTLGSQPGSYYLDSQPGAYVPNRRRAATLSPRPGLSLSHLHEDRPVLLTTTNTPSLPSFSPVPPQLLQQRHRNRIASEPFPSYDGNRTRTSSAVSLPAISHTADEFSLERQIATGTPSRFAGTFGSVREDAPSPSVTGLSDVFRESPLGFHGGGVSSLGLPSLVGGDNLRASTTSSSVGLGSTGSFARSGDLRLRASTVSGPTTDLVLLPGLSSGSAGGGVGGGLDDGSRIRAATWDEPSSMDVFGPGLIGSGQRQREEFLADDLASILKLSGAEQTNDDLFRTSGN